MSLKQENRIDSEEEDLKAFLILAQGTKKMSLENNSLHENYRFSEKALSFLLDTLILNIKRE